ncbi:TetR/AcrR family transcriptional regulator [Methylobacter sp. S3L5C]|uniref:TetR/AcrR family transcriptional regulator n=1 Tax=Methylobacter sp. S3L5C TaxID=2839024 RepID=UPI001FACDB24|nr:TetR/AcrR family transcriptional regulator [Methylobacter sp. S3L5C]UOA09680.1 TetR/AcrR family transcriptional regulator [Methylobacter sp. S3L5C]
MAKRSEHTQEELKALILSAAETIVIEEGFPALKVRRIAAEIGYTVGSIYMVFINMADLIVHVNAKTLDALSAQLGQVQACGAEHSIEALAMTYLNYASDNFNRWRTVFDYAPTEKTVTPDWYQEKVTDIFSPFKAQFAELVPELSGDNSNRAARALWFAIHGICLLSLTGQDDKTRIYDIEETLVLLIRNFISGWRTNFIK